MSMIWLSPTEYVSGDPSLEITYPSGSNPSTIVTSTTTGDLKWISIGLRLPLDVRIEEVVVCYQLSNSRNFISQVRLQEMSTPDQATVIYDDGTDLLSTTAECYRSPVGGKVPSPGKAVTLALRLNFQDTTDQILLGAVGIRITPLAGPVNARDYGFEPSATGAANTAALVVAYNVARDTKRVLYICAGVYDVEIPTPPSAAYVLYINGDMKIVGDGPDHTILRISNDPAISGAMFYVLRGKNLHVEQLTMLGPEKLPHQKADGSDAPEVRAIFTEADGNQVTLNKVKTSLWKLAIKIDGSLKGSDCSFMAGGSLKMIDSEIRSRGIQIQHNEGTEPSKQFLEVIGTRIGQDEEKDGAFTGFQPNTLIARGVSFAFRGCRFLKNSQAYGIWVQYGGLVKPFENLIQDCDFDPEVAYGISVSCPDPIKVGTIPLLYTGGWNRAQSGIQIFGDVTIVGVHFSGAGGSGYGVHNLHNEVEGRVKIIGCTFHNHDKQGYFSCVRRYPVGTNELPWDLVGCNFFDVAPTNGSCITADDGHLVIEGCNFFGTTGASHIRLDAGKHDIRRCKFFTRVPNGAGILVASQNGAVSVDLEDNEFLAEEHPQLLDSGSGRVTITGRGNRTYEAPPGGFGQGFHIASPAKSGTYPPNITGHLQFRYGIGAYDRLVTSPPAKPYTLVVNYNYDTYRLVDADEPAYDNIYVFGPIPGSHNLTIADGAVIRLIIGAKCAFLSAGNIKAAPGVRTVNSVTTFLHDATARLWYEV